jgi:hypothetical protein
MRTLAALLLTLAVVPALAETLLVGDQIQVKPADMETPTRGQSMQAVETRFGAPQTREAPRGQPPITRWDYNGFSVYFEHQHVIHTVVHGG